MLLSENTKRLPRSKSCVMHQLRLLDGLSMSVYTRDQSLSKYFEILFQFHTHRIALTADIEKVFLMFAIAEEDRDALRFLWRENVASDIPQVRDYWFCSAVFGVSSSPILLNATLQRHLNKYALSHPGLVSRLLVSLYMNDVVR